MKLEKLMERFERSLGIILIILGIMLLGRLVFSPAPKPVERVWQTEEEYEYEQFLDSIMKEELKKEQQTPREEKREARVWKKGKRKIVKVTATVYNPTENQCDEDPLITADNSKIDLNKLNSGQLKWIAVSRDLRKHFKYGSKVRISCKSDPSINGVYEVRDTMHERFEFYIDILKPIGQTKGRWKDVEISSIGG